MSQPEPFHDLVRDLNIQADIAEDESARGESLEDYRDRMADLKLSQQNDEE